jgi:hypothetical protein
MDHRPWTEDYRLKPFRQSHAFDVPMDPVGHRFTAHIGGFLQRRIPIIDQRDGQRTGSQLVQLQQRHLIPVQVVVQVERLDLLHAVLHRQGDAVELPEVLPPFHGDAVVRGDHLRKLGDGRNRHLDPVRIDLAILVGVHEGVDTGHVIYLRQIARAPIIGGHHGRFVHHDRGRWGERHLVARPVRNGKDGLALRHAFIQVNVDGIGLEYLTCGNMLRFGGGAAVATAQHEQ